MGRNKSVTEEKVHHIRVLGSLDGAAPKGFAMASRDTGETLLSGAGVDPARLQQLLEQIHRRHLSLLLVAQTECPCSSKRCASHGNCVKCATHYVGNGKQPFCFRERNKWERQCAAITGAQ